MWICLNNAFLSIVKKDGKPDELCVRARNKEHINNVFPDAKVMVTPFNDYRYRAFVSATEVAKVLSNTILGIDYDNFKNSVVEHNLHEAYSRFWSVMYRYQDQ